MKNTLAVLVVNKPGVLARISGLLSRRVFNIESIAAGYTEEPDVTRITLVVKGDSHILDQVMKQLSKLVDVIKIVELKTEDSVERELALVKVKAEANRRSDIVNLVSIFRANIVDVGMETMIIEILGDEEDKRFLYSPGGLRHSRNGPYRESFADARLGSGKV